MEERELLLLCQSKTRNIFQIIPVPYWTVECYSFGKYIREYGFYPPWLPLCIYANHGVTNIDSPAKHELESDAPCQFYFTPRLVFEWKKYSKKPCYVMYSPSVYYRRTRKVEIAPDACGTIAFPAHTTQSIEDMSDTEAYIYQLLKLPGLYQPVSVCLHMHDINKGKHKIYLKHNIPVYTAGNTLDHRFAERFYNILRKFSYSTSNLVGSYTYYSIEMGIPFFLYGNKQMFVNKDDPNIVSGEYDPYSLFAAYRVAHNMFEGLHEGISEKQKKYVEAQLGIYDGISRLKMAAILYTSFITWLYNHAKSIYGMYATKLKSFVRN